jgi:hypothetical protein
MSASLVGKVFCRDGLLEPVFFCGFGSGMGVVIGTAE